jgi:regulator of sirC expression with transglutaminase-like and TPR domain
MTERDKEIKALLQLVDDPDKEVFDTVVARLLHYGREIIPRLESVWEATIDESLQERMELLIHRVHFNDLERELIEWNKAEEPDLFYASVLIAKYRFPDLNVQLLYSQFEQIRRNIWLELNNYMTPLEQVNVLNSIIYNYCKLQGHELTERESKYFFINQVLESKAGNAYSIGIIYLAVCEALDIPIFAVDVPRQFIFAYIETLQSFLNDREIITQIQFYIDPTSGIAYTQKDMDLYLRKINAADREQNFQIMSTRQIVRKMLEELSLCFSYRREDQNADEIQQLIMLISGD